MSSGWVSRIFKGYRGLPESIIETRRECHDIVFNNDLYRYVSI